MVCVRDQTASGWFSVTTSSEGLRELVPPDAALYAAIGLQAGVLSSAYFLARLTRRRVYWLAFYLLTAALLVSFSDIGMRKVLGAGGARPRISQSADQAEPMIARLLTLRHPSPAEVVSLAIAGAFALIPLLGLPIILGKRRYRKSGPSQSALGGKFPRPTFQGKTISPESFPGCTSRRPDSTHCEQVQLRHVRPSPEGTRNFAFVESAAHKQTAHAAKIRRPLRL